MECICQHFDELPEIDAAVGDVIEYGFATVALVFHIAYLHLQTEVFCNLAGAYHRVVFQSLGLFVFLNVYLARFSVYAFDFHIGFQARFLHLEQHQTSCQRDRTDIVSGGGFDSHHITFLKREFIGIEVETFPGVLELYLYHIRIVLRTRYAFQIIEGIELSYVSAASLAADSATSDGEYIIVHSLLF